MKIYHYTKIETLRLILKNRTIRFNRLDHVDDVDEYIHGSGPYDTKLGLYTFVSCWTKDREENRDLWERYGDGYRGVRIGLEEDLFETFQSVGDLNCYKFPTSIGQDFVIPPFINPARLYDVVYLDEQEQKVKDLISEGEHGILTEISYVGIYKKLKWKVQNESRYKLTLLPKPPKQNNVTCKALLEVLNDVSSLVEDKKIAPSKADKEFIKMMKNRGIINSILNDMLLPAIPTMLQGYEMKECYYDMPMKADALNGIEVMMGPKTIEEDRKTVERILNGIPEYHIIESKLYF